MGLGIPVLLVTPDLFLRHHLGCPDAWFGVGLGGQRELPRMSKVLWSEPKLASRAPCGRPAVLTACSESGLANVGSCNARGGAHSWQPGRGVLWPPARSLGKPGLWNPRLWFPGLDGSRGQGPQPTHGLLTRPPRGTPSKQGCTGSLCACLRSPPPLGDEQAGPRPQEASCGWQSQVHTHESPTRHCARCPQDSELWVWRRGPRVCQGGPERVLDFSWARCPGAILLRREGPRG